MNQIIDMLFCSVPSLYAHWGVNKKFYFPLDSSLLPPYTMHREHRSCWKVSV